MHEPLPGRGETGIFLRASLPVRLAGYCSTGKKSLAMLHELRKAYGLGISVCSIVLRVSHVWYRSEEMTCAV